MSNENRITQIRNILFIAKSDLELAFQLATAIGIDYMQHLQKKINAYINKADALLDAYNACLQKYYTRRTVATYVSIKEAFRARTAKCLRYTLMGYEFGHRYATVVYIFSRAKYNKADIELQLSEYKKSAFRCMGAMNALRLSTAFNSLVQNR